MSFANSFAEWTVVASGTDATVTATKAARTNMRHYVTGCSLSLSAAPATTVAVQLKDGTTVVGQWEIPAEAIAPFSRSFTFPIRIDPNTAVSLTVPTGGAGCKATLVLEGFTHRV